MREIVFLLLGCIILHVISFVSTRHHHHNHPNHHHHHHSNHLIRKRSTAKLIKKAPVNSLVEDVSESTAFRDRAKKLRLVAEAGELYPVHRQTMGKRKAIPKNPSLQEDDDNDAEYANAEKKFKIAKGDDADAENEDNNDSDDNSDNDDSGSGDNDDEDDDKPNKKTKQCHRRCKMPLTFHQCAFPRCSEKLGTIKDLCFYLCKHQKEHCENVCE